MGCGRDPEQSENETQTPFSRLWGKQGVALQDPVKSLANCWVNSILVETHQGPQNRKSLMSKEESKLGYKRALDRHPELAGSVKDFEQWLESVEIWMNWVEKHIPDNIHASRAEILESFHMTPLGLEMLERLNLDIHPEGREDKERVEYDVKKLLRAVVALPTIAVCLAKNWTARVRISPPSSRKS
jgi:hypothetical protein